MDRQIFMQEPSYFVVSCQFPWQIFKFEFELFLKSWRVGAWTKSARNWSTAAIASRSRWSAARLMDPDRRMTTSPRIHRCPPADVRASNSTVRRCWPVLVSPQRRLPAADLSIHRRPEPDGLARPPMNLRRLGGVNCRRHLLSPFSPLMKIHCTPAVSASHQCLHCPRSSTLLKFFSKSRLLASMLST